MSGVMPDLTLSEVAQRVERLARHAAPLGQGRDRPARQRALDAGRRRPRAHRRAPARARVLARHAARGGTLGPARLRLLEDLFPSPARTRTLAEAAEEHRARARADRAHLGRRRLLVGLARADRRGGHPAPALHGRGARGRLPARGLPAARARVRPGAGPDRRRRGQALPPLRPRAADARRRRRPRDRRDDGGHGLRAAAARLADHGPRAPADAPALRRPGRRRPPRARERRRRTSAGCAWRSPSPTSPATRA